MHSCNICNGTNIYLREKRPPKKWADVFEIESSWIQGSMLWFWPTWDFLKVMFLPVDVSRSFFIHKLIATNLEWSDGMGQMIIYIYMYFCARGLKGFSLSQRQTTHWAVIWWTIRLECASESVSKTKASILVFNWNYGFVWRENFFYTPVTETTRSTLRLLLKSSTEFGQWQ